MANGSAGRKGVSPLRGDGALAKKPALAEMLVNEFQSRLAQAANEVISIVFGIVFPQQLQRGRPGTSDKLTPPPAAERKGIH